MTAWEILGIDQTEDLKAIKKAYASLMKKYHPEEYPEEFATIQQAYEAAITYAKGKRVNQYIVPAGQKYPQVWTENDSGKIEGTKGEEETAKESLPDFDRILSDNIMKAEQELSDLSRSLIRKLYACKGKKQFRRLLEDNKYDQLWRYEPFLYQINHFIKTEKQPWRCIKYLRSLLEEKRANGELLPESDDYRQIRHSIAEKRSDRKLKRIGNLIGAFIMTAIIMLAFNESLGEHKHVGFGRKEAVNESRLVESSTALFEAAAHCIKEAGLAILPPSEPFAAPSIAYDEALTAKKFVKKIRVFLKEAGKRPELEGCLIRIYDSKLRFLEIAQIICGRTEDFDEKDLYEKIKKYRALKKNPSLGPLF